MKLKRTVYLMFAVIAVASLSGIGDSALAAAKKKPTLEQAWKQCKEMLDREHISSVPGGGGGERYARGAACMKKLGYDL